MTCAGSVNLNLLAISIGIINVAEILPVRKVLTIRFSGITIIFKYKYLSMQCHYTVLFNCTIGIHLTQMHLVDFNLTFTDLLALFLLL